MNNGKVSPATRTRTSFSTVFAKSRTRLAAILMIMATLATAGFSATSEAGSLHRIMFGGSGSGETSPDSGGALKAFATGVMAMLSPAAQATPTPTPAPATLLHARRGHTATLLDGGGVLIVGGDDAGTAEVFNAAAQTSAVTNGLGVPRSDHTATKLADGRVIVIGGRSGGAAVASTEVYDTTSGSFLAGPSLGVARVGHSATLLSDGRILVAGGDGGGSAEIFNPATGTFSAVEAGLNSAGTMHSAALMLDGRVLIVGGRDAEGNALKTAEIFNPADSSFTAVPGGLTTSRVLPHLRVLFDGKVQIIGGSDDGSMEIYDPAAGITGANVHVLPETDTCAGLPTAVLATQTRAALFHNGQADPLLDRTGHTITELPGSSQALVAGGANSSGAVLSSASLLNSSTATITTDKLDYAPGETATLRGRGWQPGETVRLKIHEDPHTPQERGLDVVADADGNITGEYLVQDYDLNMKFIVTARGLTSGRHAQTTFTDANNDAHVAPGWAPTNTTVTFSTLYRKTTGATVQHVRVTLPVGYTNISVAAAAFSSGTWSTPVVNQVTRTIDVQLTAGTGLATNNVDWARIDVTATTPLVNQSGNAAEWIMRTFTNTAGTTGEQNDNPPVLIGSTTNPSATITFVDGSGNPIVSPVLQNGIASTVRVQVTQSGNGVKYTDIAVPTCFSSPTGVTATVSAGGNAYDTPILVTDGFIRLSGGAIAANGTLTVQFTTTPNCTSGTYLVSSDPSTNASNPPSGTNQSVSTTGGSLTVAAGLADLSITKVDSPDPVAVGGTLTYTIGVSNAGPNDASAVKVVDTLPAGTTFVSATGTNWNCTNALGTVTCNRTGGNLAPGAAPNITITVTAPGPVPTPAPTITNSATVSSPNDNTPGNNTATATTTVGLADLSITKVDSPDPVSPGATVTYTIGVSNAGPDPASAVKVVDALPTGTSFVGATGTGWTCAHSSGTVTCDRTAGNLLVGAAPNITITVTAPSSGTFTNTATVSSPNDNTPGNNTATTTTTVRSSPTASSQSVSTDEDTPKVITLQATDPDGENLTFSIVSGPTNGTLGPIGTPSCGGTPWTCTATVTYTPNSNYSGLDSFTFKANDGSLDSNTATVSITVNSVNDTPDAVNDTATLAEDSGANSINVLANDTDPDNTTPPANAGLTISAVTQGANGTVAITGGGTGLTYTPAGNFYGADSFTYTISDGNGGTDTATVSVTVTNVNDAPDAVNDSATIAEDSGANSINVLANDTDADNLNPPANAGLTVTAKTDGAHGTVAITGGGTGVSYTPAANYYGSDSFTYTITDADGATDTATVSVTITNVNDAPDAVNDSPAAFTEDSTNNAIDVLSNDTDPDNLSGPANTGLSVTAVTQGAHGTVTFTATGVSYTPNANYYGSDSFTYTISDTDGATDTATVTVSITNVNDVPDAVNDSPAAFVEDSTNNSVDVLANDTDPDNLSGPANTGLTVTAVTQGAHGSVTFTASGVSYTPNANYYGSDSFTYTISDSEGATDTATVSVTITNVNDTPDAVDDSPAAFVEDSTNNAVDVLANDSDPDNLSSPFNAGLTITAKTDGAHGTVAITGGGMGLTYTPAPNYYGTDTFTYTISDADGATDTATVSVSITNVNDTPDAVNDSPAAFTEDSTDNAVDVLANDTDPDNLSGPANAGLSVTAVTQGAHGSVTFTASGVSYTPAANYYGSDSFTYTISDADGATDTATVSVTITNVNDAPDAVNDSPAAFTEDSTNNAIDVLSNDTDPDNLSGPANAGLTVTAVTQGAHGSVAFTASGVTYTPAANYYGSDSFTYTISDADGSTDTATVSVTITNVNDTPDAVDDSPAAIAEDSGTNSFDVLANDSDPDNLNPPANAGLSVTAVTQGAHGSVTFTTSGVTYAPAANYYGSDSFTYTISDADGATDTATVNVTITNVNDTPDAVDDAPGAFVEDSTNNAIDVLANDTDPDNLAPPANAGLSVTAVTQGAHGSVAITGGGTGVSYTPAANYYGPDSFTYTISDADGATDTATVNVTVTNVNDTPDAVDDSPAAFVEDSANNSIDVLANDSDPDNLSGPANAGLSVTAVTQGTHGSVTFTATGVSYTPNANYYGTDTFTYTISDADGATDTATVNVSITNINDAPDAVNDSPAAFVEDSVNNAVDVLANDTDPDNLSGPANAGLTVTAVTQGTHGSVAITGGGTGVSYTPNANYYGSDSFTYTISDADGATDTATVTVSVSNVNDTPDAVDDSPAAFVEDSVSNAIDVLANDADPDNLSGPANAGLSVTAVTQGAHGSVTFTATGVSYTPNPNYYGSDSFTYTISDADGATDTAAVSVTITNVNDAPDAVDDAPAAFTEDSVNNAIDVLANDSDPDNLSGPANAGLSVTAVTQGAHGSVTFTASGVSYTPAANYYGPDSFTYTISDGSGGTDTAAVNVSVTNVNDTPDAVDDAPAAFAEDSSNNAIDVLANDADPDNLSGPANAGLSVTAVTQGMHGSVTFTATGVSYTPAANYYGPDSFTYTIGDADGATDTATVTVTVTNVNDTPDAVDDTATIVEDSSANSINVLANDTDPDNLSGPANAGLAVTAVTQGAHGSVSFTATGVSYTPTPNYYGPDSFSYTISDADGATDTATVSVTVTNVNDTPDAVDDSPAAFVEDSANNAVDVLANDSDPDNLSGPANAGLSVTAVTQGAHGTVAITGGGTGVSYTPAGNYFGPDSFTYTISDADGATDTATVSVTVNAVNDAPVANDDMANTNEDTFVDINVITNDTDVDNVNGDLSVAGISNVQGGTATLQPDGRTVRFAPAANANDGNTPGGFSFKYKATDGSLESNEATVTISVAPVNDAPVAANDAYGTNEDTALNVAAPGVLGNDTDAENNTLTAVKLTDPAHGTVMLNADGSFSYTPAANYNGPDSFTYKACDNGTSGNPAVAAPECSGTATVNLTVNSVNDAPANLTANVAPGSINENDSATLSGSFTDPDSGDTHTVTISWGDGSANTVINLAAGVFTYSAPHQYRDDNPTNTPTDVNAIVVTVTDNGSPQGSAGANTGITVNNLAPVITTVSGPTTPQPLGSSVTVTAPFTDAGTQDTHTCTVNWDDGPPTSGTVTQANGGGTCTASRTYASPGVYTITVTVTDDDTGSDSKTLETFIVIFDPSGGFVTGGGFIMSPPGASTLYPTAIGKANFGFVSKYKRGSNIPDGQTEFQFKAGDLNFHSSAYDPGSLVVSGHKATYRGTGTVNGVPGYRFVLIAYDGQAPGGGGVDKFRMKITLGAAVIYDNRMNVSEDVDLADPMAISGGSIVIHSK